MGKYLSRITSSARGEKFNPLIWPFFLATFAYGIGFTFFAYTAGVEKSSLYIAMVHIGSQFMPMIWGIVALLVIVIGFTFLLFNIPPAGKISGLVGFMVWVFAAFCWALTGAWLLVFAIGIPNMWFWFWQYLSLSLFRREDKEDCHTLTIYDRGGYDDVDPDVNSKLARINNRGVPRQRRR